ncbi:hypothetical protein QMK33_09805 [Hymenobacter sp. H14-R3]|uniref:hypothetical protein n=1 Tax=Hymenobacter sp. H14-R3 TaxID=3046308 RepID=UPI0024BA13D3|nr:hypothetical protein [Hymenobacter sp. H14-R3]MDJ0365448.1 hypothetical protein [Hymenobacter sp. H14-R3]
MTDTRGQLTFGLTRLRQLGAPVAIAPPEADAKLITKADFVRGKADYERTAFEQILANGNIRFGTPEQTETAKVKARNRAKRKTNPLELK